MVLAEGFILSSDNGRISVNIKFFLAWHPFLFLARKISIEGFYGVGIITAIGISALFAENNKYKVVPHLAGIGFFMYAFHGMPLTLSTKLAFRYFNPQSDMAILGLYFLCPLIVLCIGFTLYYLIARYLPRLMSLITGGR